MTAATATKAPKSPWGNPETSSYRKTFIREIDFEGVKAEVHRELLDIAVQVLHMAQEQGTLPPANPIPLVSYDPKAKAGPTAYGAALGLYGGVEGADEWGYTADEMLGLVFTATIEEAKDLTMKAQELVAARGAHPDIIPEEEEAWAHTKPGQRTLTIGSRGDDVQFIQTLLNASDHGGVFDGATKVAVEWLQERNGLPVTGEIDPRTWLLCYPRASAFGIGKDDGGFMVRVAQSLIVAYGWDPELQVTGRYGIETDRAVRRIQEQRGLRINGYMRSAEWVALLGPRDEWPRVDFGN